MKKILSLLLSAMLIFSMAYVGFADEIISVTISVYQTVDNVYIVSPVKSSVNIGSTAFSILNDTVPNVVIKDNKVVSVNGLADKQHGEGSGWIYKVNGVVQHDLPELHTLNDNDIVEWIYATDLYVAPTETTIQQHTTKPATVVEEKTTATQNNASKTTKMTTKTLKTETTETTEETSIENTSDETTTQTTATETTIEQSHSFTTRALSVDFNATLSPALEYLEENPGDYTAIILRLFGRDISDSIKKDISNKANDKTLPLLAKERLLIQISAIGEDPETFSPLELRKQIYYGDALLKQGLDAVIYALLAVPYANLTGEEDYTVDELIDLILQNQNADGSFSKTFNSKGDVDITALALTALSSYQTNASVSLATDRALTWLSSVQYSDGSFSDSKGVPNCFSTAYVLMALSSLEMRAEEDNLIQNSSAIFDALLLFFDKTAFTHTMGGATSIEDTESVLLAVAAYQLQINPLSAEFNSINQTSDTVHPQLIAVVAAAAVLIFAASFVYRKKKKSGGRK
jgi:hypothetical protein